MQTIKINYVYIHKISGLVLGPNTLETCHKVQGVCDVLGSFAKLGTATNSFIMSACVCV
jgi:hypothetical protein